MGPKCILNPDTCESPWSCWCIFRSAMRSQKHFHYQNVKSAWGWKIHHAPGPYMLLKLKIILTDRTWISKQGNSWLLHMQMVIQPDCTLGKSLKFSWGGNRHFEEHQPFSEFKKQLRGTWFWCPQKVSSVSQMAYRRTELQDIRKDSAKYCLVSNGLGLNVAYNVTQEGLWVRTISHLMTMFWN